MTLSSRTNKANQSGFTLLEVLLIIAIVAILAAIIVIVINPSKNHSDSRNIQRSGDVSTIINSVYQYALDNNGALPAGITTTATEICTTGAGTCTGLVDLTALTTSGKYLVSLPKDPQCPTGCATNGIGYRISKDSNNRLIVSAPGAEQSKTITVTK